MDNLKQICQFLANTDNPSTIARFFDEIFTPAEIHNLDSRWEIVKRLKRGDTQRTIAKDLHLGLCKITRGARELKKTNSIIKKAIKQFE
jgi:TrpR family transcriptional regulator, trp operon repressor